MITIAAMLGKKMNAFLILPLLLVFLSSNSLRANKVESGKPEDQTAILGRWDITVTMNGKAFPSWLEVIQSGNHTLVGRFVGRDGSARPISKINYSNGQLSFSIPPQWESGDQDLVLQGDITSDGLVGTLKTPDGKSYSWVAVRAPLLKQTGNPVWGTPIKLFNGKDMTGWHTTGPNQWIADSGMLRSPHSGSNIMTDKTFTNFKLHIEFRYPKESNSGVYLRGRYEVQIVDPDIMEPADDLLGAIYGFLPPNEMMAKAPGEWQSYDITLVGRLVTVVVNGKTVICNEEIPGITGGAIDSREGEPGPIYLQGDHGPVDFRNIILTPAM